MMTKILIYFFTLSAILFLPERTWERIWRFLEAFHIHMKKIQEKIPWGKEQKTGEALLNLLPDLEGKLAMGSKSTVIELPKYKFYTSLLFNLLDLHRRLGITLKPILPELRQNLIKDLQFENKLESNVNGGNLQFAVITITTWSFILLSSTLAELPLHMGDLALIFLIQCLGVLSFNIFLNRIKKRTFEKFSQAIERLYLFVSLAEIGLPVSHVLSESKVLEGELMTHKLFLPCARRLSVLVNRWRENGISPKIEAHEITRELWHLKEQSFERFLKHLDLLKFVILAFFFLPAYFFYLYSIFQFFMEQ